MLQRLVFLIHPLPEGVLSGILPNKKLPLHYLHDVEFRRKQHPDSSARFFFMGIGHSVQIVGELREKAGKA